MADLIVPVMSARGRFLKASLAALSEASLRADQLGGRAFAVVVGEPLPQEQLASLGGYGAGRVLSAGGQPGLAQSWAAAIDMVLPWCTDPILLCAGGVISLELAGRLAARHGGGIVTDVSALRVTAGALVVERHVLGDTQLADVRLTGSFGCLVARPGAFELRDPGTARAEVADLGDIAAAADRGYAGNVTVMDSAVSDDPAGTLVGADVIVTGGRGLGTVEGFTQIEALTAAFGDDAAVGATRAVVDAGWRSADAQVGSTGQKVFPRLYFAVGVSGAVQHRAGMQTATNIVAINNDPDAAIFAIADLGVVADLNSLVPALTAAIVARQHG